MNLIFLILVAFVLSCGSPALAADKGLFHPPQTEAEKVLDAIIRAADSQPEIFQILLQNPKYNLSKVKEFEGYFTQYFIASWKKFEKELVDKYCGGVYQKGNDCGYDINPISCPLHGKSPYLYHTVIGDNDEVIVTAKSSHGTANHGIYYMKHENGAWRMGGLYCEEGIPDTIPAKELTRKFRAPRYESEKALENIIQTAREDGRAIPFIFGLSWRDKSKDRDFSRLFTPALLQAWRQQSENIIQRDCSEIYINQGLGGCDIFPHPITCELQEDNFLITRTVTEKENRSTVVYSYPDGTSGARFVYRMLKEGNTWKLDAAFCGNDEGYNFNMPDDGYLSGAR